MSKLKTKIKAEADKIQYDVTKEMSAKIPKIQAEIYGYFKSVVYNVVEKTFVEAYGDSFDLASLQDSIMIPNINSFYSDFSYNKNKLKFYPKLNDRIRPFNLNQRKEYLRKNNPKDPDFYTGDSSVFWDFYNNNEFDANDTESDSNSVVSEEDLVADLINDYHDFKPANQRLNLLNNMSLDEVYTKAKTRALIEFDRQYETFIKPQINKKYGVKL